MFKLAGALTLQDLTMADLTMRYSNDYHKGIKCVSKVTPALLTSVDYRAELFVHVIISRYQ